MYWTNHHSHCNFCDGSHPAEVYVEHAIQEKVPVYGFSSHAPLHVETPWNMPAERLAEYLTLIDTLKEKYKDQIQLYKSLEIDYLDNTLGVKDFKKHQLDYSICSIHFTGQFDDGSFCEADGAHRVFLEGMEKIFHGDVKAHVSRYYRDMHWMLENDPPNILGHMDRIRKHDEDGRLFDIYEPWYTNLVEDCLQAAKRSNVIIEVNTKEMYKKGALEPYPSYDILTRIKELNIPIMLNSDTHRPFDITKKFKEVALHLKELGFQELMVFWNNEFQAFPFDENGVKLPI